MQLLVTNLLNLANIKRILFEATAADLKRVVFVERATKCQGRMGGRQKRIKEHANNPIILLFFPSNPPVHEEKRGSEWRPLMCSVRIKLASPLIIQDFWVVRKFAANWSGYPVEIGL